MTKGMWKIVAIAMIGFAFTGCARRSYEMWEDTKTASRYMNKGLRSFFGKHGDYGDVAYEETWGENTTYLGGFSENERHEMGLTDLGQTNYPLSKESPGDPGSPIPGIDGFSSPSGNLASIFTPVFFETDKYDIKAKEVEAVASIANYLKNHPSTYVFVEGHCDERGAAAYNLSLGSRRANSIRTFLIQNGVSQDQIFTISYGKERPVVSGHDEPTWQQNRRGQFKIFERR